MWAAADSSGRAPGDSLRTMPADSLADAAHRFWISDWAPRQTALERPDTLATRLELARASALFLADAVERETPLAVLRAGGDGAWDEPYWLGAGTERLRLWAQGAPAGGPGFPGAALVTQSVLATGTLLHLAPSPFLDPLAEAADGWLWAAAGERAWEATPSAVRLTEGPGGSATEDFQLARQAGAWRLLGSYADSRSEGRPSWITPRYTGSRRQNLHLALERAATFGSLRLAGYDRYGRAVIESNRKLTWEGQHLTGGWQWPAGDLAGQLLVTRRNELLRWWGDLGADRRRSTSTDARLQAAWRRGGATWLGALAVQRVASDLSLGGQRVRDDARWGYGLGGGLRLGGDVWEATGQAGYSDPWWGEGGVRFSGTFAWRPRPAFRVCGAAWRQIAVALTPRVDGDGRALLAEGLWLPGGRSAADEEARGIQHLEVSALALHGASTVRVFGFQREVTGVLGARPELAEFLAPERWPEADLAALRKTVRYRGWGGALHLALPLGAALEADGRLLSAPARDALPLLVPRYQARAVALVRRRLFQGDLVLEGRLTGTFRDGWATPYGTQPALARYDAELRGRVMRRADLFFATRHLENGPQPSGTYADGEFAPLPYRSSQVGVEWHFFR